MAVGLIIENFPKIDRLVSPFFGGGSVEIAVATELKVPVIASDIFDILVNFWQVLKNNKKELYYELVKLDPNPQIYKEIKNELKEHWDKKIKLGRIALARDYYFNFNLSYGPGFLGWMSKVYANKEIYKKS